MGLALSDGLLHVFAAGALVVQPLLLRLFAAAQVDAFAHAVAQHRQNLRHFADLVAAIGFGNLRLQLFLRNRPHRALQPLDRAHDAAHDRHGRQRHGKRAAEEDDAGLQHIGAKQRIEIVGIDAGADHPAPGLETGDMRIFQHRLLEAGLRPVIIDEAFAGGARLHRLDEFLEDMLAGRVGHAGLVGAVHFRLDRMHDDAGLHVVDPEIAALFVAQRPHRILGPRLRLLARDRTGRFKPMEESEQRQDVFIERLQLGLALGDHGALVMVERIGHGPEKAGQRQSHKQIQSRRKSQSLHPATPVTPCATAPRIIPIAQRTP